MPRSSTNPIALLGLVGLPLGIAALLSTLHGLPGELGLVPGVVLGVAAALCRPPTPDPRRRQPWVGPAILGLAPLLLLAAAVTFPSNGINGPLSGLLLSALFSWSLTSILIKRGGWVGDGRVLAAATAAGLLPAIYQVVPHLGPVVTGLVGGLFCVAASLSARPEEGQSDSPPSSVASGILLGAGVPTLLLLGAPVFGPSIPWFGEALTAVLLGFALAAFAGRGRRLPAVAAALLLVAVGEGVSRSPEVVAWLLATGIPPEAAGLPLAASLVTLVLFGAVGLSLCGSRPSGPGLLLGCLLWLVLPSLTGAETALRATAAAAALAALLESQGSSHRLARPLAAAAVALVVASLALPTPPRGPQVLEVYESYTDAGELSHRLRTSSWRTTARTDSSQGSLLWFRDDGNLVWWDRGRAGRSNESSLASDSFFAHLPGLVGPPPSSVVVINPGAGGSLDPARRTTSGGVWTWASTASHRRLLHLEAPGSAGSDPAVRIRVGYGLGVASQSSKPHDAVLVDLPPPWVPGGSYAWGPHAVKKTAKALSDRGVAVFRVHLGQVTSAALASLVQNLAKNFGGLSAWLDPTGSEHLLLLARNQGGATDAGAPFRAFGREAIRKDLRRAALRDPADVLERFLLDREGLLEALPESRAWSPTTSAILSGARSRTGGAVLPLAELSAGTFSLQRAFDFTTVPEQAKAGLQEQLTNALAARADYLSLLEAIALGDGAHALVLAQRVAQGSEDPTKDLRSLIQPWLSQGDRFREQHLLEQAKAEYMIAVSFSPRDPDANLKLARVERDLGELASARERYEAVRALEATSLSAALGLASVLELEGNYREAANLLEDAEKLHPGDAILLINLGALHLRMAFGSDEVIGKHVTRARMLFQTAASLEPRLPQPHGGLAEVFTLLGEHERALSEIDRAIALEDQCTYRGWRGQILWELGRNSQAESELTQALMSCPDHLPALVALGGVLVDRGCYQQGREAWERVSHLEPGNMAARANLEQLTLSGVEATLGESQCQ